MAKIDRVQEVSVDLLKPYENNAKIHSEEQVQKIADSIQEFGFISPCLIDKENRIIAGHGRVMAAKILGMKKVPCVYVEGLTDAQRRAYILADNRLTELGDWSEELLQWELNQLELDDFDVTLIGFDPITKEKPQADREEAKETLADRFLVSPFTVFDSRQKWWQDRKRAWRALGIDSGVGRGNDGEGTTSGLTYANSHMPPGVYKAKNRAEEALGKNLSWDEFFDVYPQYGVMSNTSIFDPVVCEIAYRWYTKPGDRIIDPFAGGSVRGVTAALLGRSYTGVDLSERQIDANNENWQNIPHERITDGEPAEKPTWIVGDSQKISKLVSGGGYDFLFTCPPYADLEVYSDNPDDLSTMDYDDFCEAYENIIAESVKKLKQDAFAVVVVGDVRDKKGNYRDFVSFTISAFRKAGMSLYNEAILITSTGAIATTCTRTFEATRKLSKCHQNVLIFADSRGEIREMNLVDEEEQEKQIRDTVEENDKKLTVAHKKILTFSKGNPKRRTEELGPVDTETDETFEVELL